MGEIHLKVLKVRLDGQEERRRVWSKIRNDEEIAYLERKMGERGPTPETAAKVMRHPIEDLYLRNIIDDGHQRALSDIQDAFQIITFGSRLRMATLDKVDNQSSPEGVMAADVDLTTDYSEWRSNVTRDKWIVCIDVGVSGAPLRDLAKSYGCRYPKVKELLIDGLDEYNVVKRKNNRLRSGNR